MFPMDAPTAPHPTDPDPGLSLATYRQITHALRPLLPPPVSDSPEDAAQPDPATIAPAASLRPATPDEVSIAAQYVAASAQALDCIRLARAYPNDPANVLKCTAQSASMMRQARGWRLALERAQA